jgi:hypothetical protein
MKKHGVLTKYISIFLLFLTPQTTYANEVFKFLTQGVPDRESLKTLILAMTDLALTVTGVLAAIYIVLGGLTLITSAGNSKKIEAAKSGLTAAIVGLIIILLSKVIIKIFIRTLGGNVTGL